MRLCSIRNLNNQLKKLEILSNLKRSHSTSPSSSSSLVSTIPRNLQIQDMSVLDTPPVPKIERMDYLFPTKNVPKTIDVYPFFSSSSKLNSTEGTIDPIEQESDIDVAPLPVSISSVPLDARIFGVAIRKDIVHECVRYMRHKRRQPHKTKRMSEIRGSNKKPWQQKGLGRAQFGHKRNSVWRGGQKAHGPVLRDFDIGLNKKMRAMGMMIAIAAKQREGNLIVVDNFDCTSFKTKYVYWALRRFQIHEKKTLMVDGK